MRFVFMIVLAAMSTNCSKIVHCEQFGTINDLRDTAVCDGQKVHGTGFKEGNLLFFLDQRNVSSVIQLSGEYRKCEANVVFSGILRNEFGTYTLEDERIYKTTATNSVAECVAE